MIDDKILIDWSSVIDYSKFENTKRSSWLQKILLILLINQKRLLIFLINYY